MTKDDDTTNDKVLNEIVDRVNELGEAVGPAEEIQKLCQLAGRRGHDPSVVAKLRERLAQGSDVAKELAARLGGDETPTRKTGPSTALRGPRPPATNAGKSSGSDSADVQQAAPVRAVDSTKTDDDTQGSIPLTEVDVSRWNRSFESKPDLQYIKRLAESIAQDGLLQPIVLVADNDDKVHPHKILAGAGRAEALRAQRGKDAALQPNEYVVRTDLTEADAIGCTRISITENLNRRKSSVIETARYVKRLLGQGKLTQAQIGDVLQIPRESIGRLADLVEYFDKLPRGWKQDLEFVPGADADRAPRITRSHWDKIAGRVKKSGVTKELGKKLQEAYDKRLSVAELDSRLNPIGNKKKKKGKDSKKNQNPGGNLPGMHNKPSPVEPGDDKTGAEARTPADTLKEAIGLLNQSVAMLETEQEEVRIKLRFLTDQVAQLVDDLIEPSAKVEAA